MLHTYLLNDEGLQRTKELKSKLQAGINDVLALLPEGREKSIFKTKVEEAAFFATRAIAMQPENHKEVISY